jgi:UDPglucose 6-dehydrogenase
MKRISVAGLGFVGLSTAVFFADKGYQVFLSSNDKAKVSLTREGRTPFFEPELERALKRALGKGTLIPVLGRSKAISEADVIFVTVGTPSLSDGAANLSFIKETAKEIGKAMKKKQTYQLIVVKSTVPPGTTENVVRPILEEHSDKRAGKDFGLTMSPEFLREGSSLYDVSNPDRILIGELDKRSGDSLEELNREAYHGKVPILRMSLASAELAKYASNCFLAAKISFMNEMANICERLPRVDVTDMAKAMGMDPRIGKEFLKAGAGWGGSCFPKDTKALVSIAKNLGYKSRLVKDVIAVNTMQSKRMVEIAEEELGNLRRKNVAVLGLSFKPETDDIREAPSLRIIELLLAKGAKVIAFDPVASENARRVFGNRIDYAKDVSECLRNADCCMLVTEWGVFKKLQPEDFTGSMRKPILIDGRRIYDHKKFSKKLKLRAIGLNKSTW